MIWFSPLFITLLLVHEHLSVHISSFSLHLPFQTLLLFLHKNLQIYIFISCLWMTEQYYIIVIPFFIAYYSDVLGDLGRLKAVTTIQQIYRICLSSQLVIGQQLMKTKSRETIPFYQRKKEEGKHHPSRLLQLKWRYRTQNFPRLTIVNTLICNLC